jgi:cell division protein FtsI (penicillin-binding protein 3)
MRPGSPRKRLRILLYITLAGVLLGVGQVIKLQTFDRDSLESAGRAQRVSESVLPAQRGTIFARDGGELALSVPSSTLYANPKLVTDPTNVVSVLGSMLGLDDKKRQSLLQAFTEKTKGFVYIARQIDDQAADAVMALQLPGIDRLREDKRIMPSGEVGRSILGTTNIDGTGVAGIEKQFDLLLTGVPGERVREHDLKGRSIPGSGTTTIEPVPGRDLVLTIDRSLQFQVEQALIARVDQTKGKGGTVVVMDTATGDIYAAANVERGEDDVVRVTNANRAAVDAFEPGSVAKVFSMAAVVDMGAASPDTTITVPGYKVFDEGTQWETKIKDAEPHGDEPMSMRQILVHSSNIGTFLLAERIGSEKLAEYLDRFGFGHRTAVGFPGETKGVVYPASEWQGTEKATVTFGYHYQASALQFAAAVNAVANGGMFVQPRLLRAVIGSQGDIVEMTPSETHRVVSPAAAATMTSMLTDVVCVGTGKEARIEGISVAGKTGTAYKALNGSYGIDGERAYRASFVGYFPAQAPRVTVLVTIDEPDPTSSDRFGGKAAAPLFATIAKAAIHDLEITPTPGDQGCASKG